MPGRRLVVVSERDHTYIDMDEAILLKISRAPDSDIVVTNVAGQLISRGRATGGQFSWNGRSLDGGLAPSGIYLFWVSGPNGSKVTVAQGVIIR